MQSGLQPFSDNILNLQEISHKQTFVPLQHNIYGQQLTDNISVKIL